MIASIIYVGPDGPPCTLAQESADWLYPDGRPCERPATFALVVHDGQTAYAVQPLCDDCADLVTATLDAQTGLTPALVN